MTAEFWSHQSPLILIRQTDQGSRFYFPAFYNYSVAEFGITDSFVVDFPKLIADDLAAGKKDWAIFPLNRWDPYFQGPDVLAAPSHEHWLGTDSLGRDVFARLIYGIRVSLAYGMLYWLFSFFVGCHEISHSLPENASAFNFGAVAAGEVVRHNFEIINTNKLKNIATVYIQNLPFLNPNKNTEIRGIKYHLLNLISFLIIIK